MNSLAGNPTSELITDHSATSDSAVSRRSVLARLSHRGIPKFGNQAGVFIALSLVVHTAASLTFTSAPSPALAAAVRSTPGIEVDLLAPAEPEPVPQGKLEAPLANSPTQPSVVAPPTGSATHSETAPAPTTIAAPEILAVDNPYADGSNTVFVSGHGSEVQRLSTVVKSGGTASAATQTASFGVASGQATASEQAKRSLSAWYKQVRAQLAAAALRDYPVQAQKLGQQGTVKIAVHIAGSGAVTGTDIASSSTFSLLDAAALSGLSSIAQVDAPPPGTGTTHLTVPVTFRLR